MILLSVTNVAFGEVSAKDFSPKIHRTYHQRMWLQFEDGRDYFSYQEPIEQAKEAIVKFRSSFL